MATKIANTESQRKHWLRLWHDMPTDPKFRTISKRSGRPITEVIAVFIAMMTNASANAAERGALNGWSHDDVASGFDMETEHVAAIYEAMQGKVLDGEHLIGWEKRQPKREDGSAERAKEWRERNRTQSNEQERQEERREDKRREEVVTPFSPPLPKAKAKDHSKRGSRLPADWALPADWRNWAQINFSPDDETITLEAERFRDFWIAKAGSGGCKLDWEATWRNWCRNSKVPATNVRRPPMEHWRDKRNANAKLIYDLAMGANHG